MTEITFHMGEYGYGPKLYKLDSTGRLRSWQVEVYENQYRVHAGLADGKQAISGWTTCTGKQGRTDREQAQFEARAATKHQLDREYHDNPDSVVTPKMIEPMLAKAYGAWPGPGYSQPKLDGIRCIMTAAGMFSRQGQEIVAVPHLHAACAPLFAENPDLVLDGELYNHELRDDFGAISSIVRKKNPTADALARAEKVMEYHVYDIVDPDTGFEERAVRLNELIENLGCGWIVLVETDRCRSQAEADQAYGEAVAAGYEGGMYRLDAPYELGRRSKNLLKRKEFITEEFPVVAIEEGNGNWAGCAKRMTLRLPNGATFGAGIRGTQAAARALLGHQLSDKAVATCRYFMLSPDGVPRFPVVIDFHPEGRKD